MACKHHTNKSPYEMHMPERQAHTHIKTEMSQTCTHTNPKPVFPACVRNDCQEAGYPTSPVARRLSLITRLKLSVSERLFLCVCKGEGRCFVSRAEQNLYPLCDGVQVNTTAVFFFIVTYLLCVSHMWLCTTCMGTSCFCLFCACTWVGCSCLCSLNPSHQLAFEGPVLLLPFPSAGHPFLEEVGSLPPQTGLLGGLLKKHLRRN